MPKFYFTFMGKQHDTRGRSLAQYYVVIEAQTESLAREKYFAKYGDQFFTSYDEERFASQAEQYGLQEIGFDDIDLCCGIAQEVIIENRRAHEMKREMEGEQ